MSTVNASANFAAPIYEKGMFVPYGNWPHPMGVQIFDKKSATMLAESFNSLLSQICKATLTIDPDSTFSTLVGWMGQIRKTAPIYDGHPDDKTKEHKFKDKTRYGCVTNIIPGDSGCLFRTEMFANGKDLIDKKGLVKFSPFWGMEDAGNGAYRPKVLLSIGLTNNPNIPVPPMSNEGHAHEFAEALGDLISASNDFDPGQERDFHGRWAAGGEVGETSKSREAKEGESYREATPEDRKRLGIAPGYKDVKVTDDPKAEKLWKAKTPDGKDKSGYSSEYQKENEGAKWKRIESLHKDYHGISERVEKDVKEGGKDAHPAMAVKLMNRTGLRNGGEGETKIKVNGKATGETAPTYGASSLKTSHASTEGNKVHLDFQGKDNIRQQHSFTDPQLAEHIRQRQKEGADKLFDTNDAKTRDYLNKISGDKYKVHDLRTYHATTLADHLIRQRGGMPSDPKAFKRAQLDIADEVSKELGNGRDMALKNYIHPEVWHKAA